MVNMLYSQKEKAVTTQSNEIDYPLDELRSKDEFIAMGSFNSVFIICSYLRGMEQFLIDLLQNKKIAQRLIGEVGEFVLEFKHLFWERFLQDYPPLSRAYIKKRLLEE